MNKAVVLGCNYYIGLSAIRCLGRAGVPVVACDYDFQKAYGAKSKYVAERLKIQKPGQEEEESLRLLVAYAQEQSEKPVLLPTHDKYVEFIDRYYDQLAPYFHLSQAPGGLNTRIMDKWKLSEVAQKHGVRIPTTIAVDDDHLKAKVEQISFPCIIKPVDTIAFTEVFRNKVFLCHNEEELEKGIRDCQKNHIVAFVQQIIPGFDDHMLTYDCYINQSGRTTHWVTFQKQRQWPINFGASVFTIQKHNQDLVNIGKPFLEAIGYRGFGEIEFKKHEKTGDLYLIEINARTTNFNNLIYKLGFNMPYIAYLELTGRGDEIEEKYMDYHTNHAFIYGYEDFMALRAYSKTKQLSFFKGWAQIFTKRLAPAIWALDDLMPWWSFNGMLWGKVFQKLFRRS